MHKRKTILAAVLTAGALFFTAPVNAESIQNQSMEGTDSGEEEIVWEDYEEPGEDSGEAADDYDGAQGTDAPEEVAVSDGAQGTDAPEAADYSDQAQGTDAAESAVEVEDPEAADPSMSSAEETVQVVDDAGLIDSEDTVQVNGYTDVIEEPAEGTQDLIIENISSEDGDPVILVESVETVENQTVQEQQPLPLLDYTHVCVHDPSVFVDPYTRIYYVLGSHTASASSEDLAAWKQINDSYGNGKNVPFYGNLNETLEKPFEWAGYDDGDCTSGYAVWAPDIIWNPIYEWEDGTLGAYMIYCCTSSTWRRSCISYLVAKDMNDPFVFGDTIVYSGFTENGAPDGNSKRNTRWDNDYLNLKHLVELGAENGGIDEVSDKWFTADGGWDNTYAPNAIDPTVFFDATGERMYMVYGSWSGGMFLLELDKRTGEAIYPGVDSIDEVSGNYVDRYFGVHLIGGNHQSGEGPYIQYDEETGYYYLYCTYGGLQAEGGYNMRLFRSQNVTGPYLDAAGNNAADNKDGIDSFGIKLIGNYSFYNQIGKRAAGHNSMLIDMDNSRYLVYHQRFEIDPQLEAHEVRVHQQFLNEDNWPVTAVYEYRGEQPEYYADWELIGSYEFINHGLKTNGEMLDTGMLNLNEDGSVTGAASGTWSRSDSGKGYDYLTLVLDDVTYKGYFFRQHKENNEENPVMTFSAVGDNNMCVWGSAIDTTNNQMMAEMAAVSLTQAIPVYTREDLVLPSELMGCRVTWKSEDESVLTSDGHVFPQEEDVRVKLTATIKREVAVVEKTFKITVRKPPVFIVGYDFEQAEETLSESAEGNDSVSAVPAVSGGTLSEPARLIGTAQIIADETRGNVLEVKNEAGAKGVNYLKLPEDTLRSISNAGYTVAFWTKIGADTFEHSALFEADADAQYPLTRIGANLIARINANAYSDVMGSLLETSGEREVWQHVAYTVDPYGIKVYLNGKLVGQEDKNIKDCFKKNKTGISQAKNVMVGAGWIWDDEDCRQACFDDVRVYDGVLGEAEIAALCE